MTGQGRDREIRPDPGRRGEVESCGFGYRKQHMARRLSIAVALVLSLAASCRLAAQDAAPAITADEAAPPAKPAGPPLSDEQAAIRVRFDRFEETLLKMAGYLQKREPARAELVLRALSRSREERVAERMQLVSGMLTKGEGKAAAYADAIEEQEAIVADLRELLTILRSEDILDENRKEQERLKELARQITALIDAEKVHQADTGRGEPTDRIAQGQERTAKRTGEVVEKIDAHDRSQGDEGTESSEPSERPDGQPPKDEGSESQDGQSGKNGRSPEGAKPKEREKPSDQGKPTEGEGEPKPSDGEQERSRDGQSGQKGSQQKGSQRQSGQQQDQQSQGQQQNGQQQEGQQQGQQQRGQQGESQDSQPQEGEQQEGGDQSSGPPKPTPGRDELEAARDRMERAIEELKKQNRGGASQAQEEAIKKLIEAKERIEELLRQLREEEREMMLRALEARFQKMLQLQQVVLDTTEELNPLPNEKWQDREFARCRDAAATEREILIEADKALEVLRADGSSVAFPEAVEQIRTDVTEVAARLGREDAGTLTVAIEKEIVDALQEMILALQKEMEKLREKKGQQGQQGQPGDPSLVDKLAELKMLKTLQLRVNRRTKTLGQLFEGEQATDPEVVSQLRELAARQGRLQQATYDLAVGKTAN